MLRPPRRGSSGLLVLAGLLLLAFAQGCGSSGDSSSSAPPAEPAVSSTADFPGGAGRSVSDLVSDMPEGPILAPSVAVLKPGATASGSRCSTSRASSSTPRRWRCTSRRPTGPAVKGPYPVRDESLAVSPAFRSQTTGQGPGRRALGVRRRRSSSSPASTACSRAGATLDGRRRRRRRRSRSRPAASPGPPGVGDKAIRVHTPTAADVGGDLSKIDTRVPPATALHKDRLRRRARQEARRARVRDPAAVPEPGLRAGRRTSRPRSSRSTRTRSPSSTRRSTRTTTPTRATRTRWGSGTWRPSRGRS